MMPIQPDVQLMWQMTLEQVIKGGFAEAVSVTTEWLNSPLAKEYFMNQQGMLNTFFRESGIIDQWDNIIKNRAQRGVTITEQIYDYARRLNMEDHLVPYTNTERMAMNLLCDNNYELIVNVTRDEITSIRRQLVQDYAEGRHPSQTTLKELQLQPINGWSPEQRAEVISRTESARALNVSTLETLRGEGVEMVELYGCDPKCDVCGQYASPTPIDVALQVQVPHPNCTGVWVSSSPVVPVGEEITGNDNE